LKRNETSQDFDGASVVSLFGVGDQGFAWSLQGDGKTARIMQVSKVTLPAIMATSPEITKMQEDVGAGFSRDVQDIFIKSLRQAANVKINETLWKQNSGSELAGP
jgi:peptidyl-prolyl cis-trans isomerase D